MCAKEKPGKKNDVRSFSSSSNFLNVVVMMIEGIFEKDVSKKAFRIYSHLHLHCVCICVFLYLYLCFQKMQL